MVREARTRLGLSQRRLAVRAGTSQDAISRIERGVETPTVERLAQILFVLGCRLRLEVESLGDGSRPEPVDAIPIGPEERLREAAGWNRFASGIAAAGERARREGHPATVRHE
jgi:transcriptional regulator with XRE-family HTH domain